MKFLAVLMLGAIVIGVPLIVGFIGAFIMSLLGLYYTSVRDLVWFFICFFMIEFPLGFVASNLPKVLGTFGIISENTSFLLQLLLNFLLAMVILLILDTIFKDITAPIQSILGFSLFYTMLDYVFEDNKDKSTSEKSDSE